MPNTSKGYNGSTDFLKWYKGTYGTDYDKDTGLVRKEGMSDGDWDVGTILHNYYIKNQQNEADRQEKINSINQRYDGMRDTAMAGYDSARQALGENKATAQQNASITYDKLRKYLPMKQQAQGLGGLGTQSAELDAYNKYMSQMGGIASDYQENMRAIDTEETSSLGELERYRTDSLDEADTLYDNLGRSYADSADDEARAAWDGYLAADKQSKDEAYAMAQSILGASTSGNLEELMTYVNGLSGKVSPEQLAALGEYAKSVADANYKKATDEQTSKQQSDYNNAYNMALGVLQSATTDNPEELMAYVNSLEGKVSPEQFAALQQIAQNVAGTNLKAKTDADQENANIIVETVVSGMLDAGNLDAAREYLENNKEFMGQSTYDAYSKVVDSYVKEEEKTTTEEEQAATDEKITAGKEYLTYKGIQFKLGDKLESDANEIAHNDSFREQLQNMNFDGPYDSNIPNGTTFMIRRDVTGGDKVDGWDFVPIVRWFNTTAGGLEKYITYYNGEWYFSERADGKSAAWAYAENGTEIQPFVGTESSGGNGSNTGGTIGGSGGRGNSSSGISTNSFLKAYANTPQYDSPAAQGGAAFIKWLMSLSDK